MEEIHQSLEIKFLVSDGSPVDPLTTVFIFTRVTSVRGIGK